MKTILITGSTDGLGLATAEALVAEGHRVLIHGRNPGKLDQARKQLQRTAPDGQVETFLADLARIRDVETLAKDVAEKHDRLDVLINNAGVFNTPTPRTPDGLDVRFVVNTIAPYLLTRRLLSRIAADGRVINLSSAAQAPVDLRAFTGAVQLADFDAYAQSKLALTMWTRSLAREHKGRGPVFIAVNPGSMLATKMVKDAFGVPGADIRIGVDILRRAALSDEFANVSGAYYDNDAHTFAEPHPDALNTRKAEELIRILDTFLDRVAD